MKKSIIVISLAMLALSCTMTLYASWAHNYINGHGDNEGDSLVVEGASAFLLSFSDVILLINQSEIGVNGIAEPASSLALVESALNRLTESRQRYQDTMLWLKLAGPKQVLREKLKNFDYSATVNARGLDKRTMEKVSAYLKTGDRLGLLKKSIGELEQLEQRLKFIRDSYSHGKAVHIEVLRELFQGFSNFMRTGYYSSLVFSSIISE